MPASDVTVVTSTEGTETAGSLYSVICTVTKPATLLVAPDITWINPSGIEISGQVNSAQIGNTTVDTVTVQLNPLLVSHGGLYTCEVLLVSSSLLALNLSSTAMVTTQSKLR